MNGETGEALLEDVADLKRQVKELKSAVEALAAERHRRESHQRHISECSDDVCVAMWRASVP
jgi:hypothetical protein